MKNLFSTDRVAAFTVTAFILLAGLTARATVYNWTNTGGGNWSITNNWSPNQVPGATDTAVITTVGIYVVTLDVSPTVAGLDLGASSGSQSFVFAGNTLTVNGPIQVNSQGHFNLASGALAGTNVRGR